MEQIKNTLKEIKEFLKGSLLEEAPIVPVSAHHNKNIDLLIEVIETLFSTPNKNKKDDVSAACNDYLKVIGYISLAFSWFKIAKVSQINLSKNKEIYEEKINTAKHYYDKILPRVDAHYKSAKTGSDYIMKANFN